jgi:hypothetical protein
MTARCEDADIEVLKVIAKVLVDQIGECGLARAHAPSASIKAAMARVEDGRKHLLREINGKLQLLGCPAVTEEIAAPDAKPGEGSAMQTLVAMKGAALDEARIRDRLRAAIDDERPCAHTRNFLQTVLSRLERASAELAEV